MTHQLLNCPHANAFGIESGCQRPSARMRRDFHPPGLMDALEEHRKADIREWPPIAVRCDKRGIMMVAGSVVQMSLDPAANTMDRTTVRPWNLWFDGRRALSRVEV